MAEILFENKQVELATFVNYDQHDMFSITFKVPADSINSYRGFRFKKAKKVAKWLRKMAQELDKL